MGKSKKKIKNWPEYNRALTQRGLITFWVDESAITFIKRLYRFHFSLINVPLRCPNYSSISKLAKTVEIKYLNQSKGAIRHIAIQGNRMNIVAMTSFKYV